MNNINKIIGDQFADSISNITKKIEKDPLIYKYSKESDDVLNKLKNDFFSEKEEYIKYLDMIDGKKMIPHPIPNLTLNILYKTNKIIEIKIILENLSNREFDENIIDNGFYNTKIIIKLNENLQFAPYKFYQLPDSYKYNPDLIGYGINCTIKAIDKKTIKTDCIPVYIQKQLNNRELEYEDSIPFFNKLLDDPISVLRSLKNEMEKYDNLVWGKKLENAQLEGNKEIISSITADRDKFQNEIQRFKEGIENLEKKQIALNAFKLMNKTFALYGEDKGYNKWYPFQIIFIVSVISDILCNEYEDINNKNIDKIDLLWFPTGGGKTEAYLGLAIFNSFFDRLRGKKYGVTVMMRYPLRLLSLQQFHRIVDLYDKANIIRKQERIDGDEFSVGFFAGKSNTPNEMKDILRWDFNWDSRKHEPLENLGALKKFKEDIWNNNEEIRKKYQIIERCPRCKNKIFLDINEKEVILEYRCTNKNCKLNKILVYTLDNEIYRYLPTLIIGTQDKLAGLGYQRKFRHILGYIKAKCPIHGYNDGTECTEKHFCKLKKKEFLELIPKDPAPLLHIQDELHLIKEELGTFESHYWSTMEKLIKWKEDNNGNIKIVAATATIEDYQRQAKHIYLKNTILFPSSGPEFRKSFYVEEDNEKIQRFYVGIMPWNKSHINSIINILLEHQRIVQLSKKNYEEEKNNNKSISNINLFGNIMKYYKTAVVYVGKKTEGDRLSKSVDTQINETLKREKFQQIKKTQLTGETKFSKVNKLLENLEKIGKNGMSDISEINEMKDLIIATSTISHGVDLDILNFMIFFGMPGRTAEYIQSSSRVGRNFPGVVITCFHPILERDRSHYHFFFKYHEYLERLVEPVPVNRWAKFSIDRTLPGILASLILQYHYDGIYKQFGSPWRTVNVAKAFSNRFLQKKVIINRIKEIYSEPWNEDNSFSYRIEELVDRYVSSINNQEEKFIMKAIGNIMKSLRDVDEQIPIYSNFETRRMLTNLCFIKINKKR